MELVDYQSVIETARPTREVISVEEFNTTLQKTPEIYDTDKDLAPPEHITRANFTSVFFVESFKHSQGIPQAQAAVFAWYDKHRNFDSMSTIANYFEAGGITCLSEEEREFISQSRKRYPGIHRPDKDEYALRIADQYLRYFLNESNESYQELPNLPLPNGLIEKEWGEFIPDLYNWIKQARPLVYPTY